MREGELYGKYHIHNFIKEIKYSLIKEIKDLKSINKDSDEVRLSKKYKLGPLQLLDPKPISEAERVESVVDFNGNIRQEYFKMNIEIPFYGNANLFFCRPMTYSYTYPDIERIDTLRNVLEFTIKMREINEVLYKSAVNNVIHDFEDNIKNINNDILAWDNNLGELIERELTKQESFNENRNDFYTKIGLTKNQKADEFITPSPITRKIIPQPKIDNTKTIKKIAPVLQDEVYKDILNTLYNVGKAIEKKPSIYIGKDEEALRDILLLFLETRYESTTATGETFNKKGKVDILLKHSEDSSNLFVAECKIWSGPSDFLKAIDQLLGYLTHRDSKSALLIFVDNENFVKTKETLISEIQKHKSFKSLKKENDDFSIRYNFILPEEVDINIEMEIMLFHFPERKKLKSQ